VGLEWVWGLLQPGFVRWAPPPTLLHKTTLTTELLLKPALRSRPTSSVLAAILFLCDLVLSIVLLVWQCYPHSLSALFQANSIPLFPFQLAQYWLLVRCYRASECTARYCFTKSVRPSKASIQSINQSVSQSVSQSGPVAPTLVKTIVKK